MQCELLQFFAYFDWISSRVLPAPSDIVTSAIRLVSSGDMFEHIWVSTERALLGLAIGGTIGFIFGILNGVSKVSGST